MVSFGNETLVCMGSTAVDGLVAVAAPACQRTSGCQFARLLPPERRPSLHDAAGDDDGRLRHAILCSLVSVPILETGRKPSSGRCLWCSADASFSACNCGRCRHRRPIVSLLPSRTVTLCTRTSNCASLHPCLPSLDAYRTSIDLEHKPARLSRSTPCSRRERLQLCQAMRPWISPTGALQMARKMTERETCRKSFC